MDISDPPLNITIQKDDLRDGQVIELLKFHHAEMFKYSPPESIHSLDESSFFNRTLTFWSARDNGNLLACGALKSLGNDCGEIKAMRTANNYLRLGLASKILNIILQEAESRCYEKVYLETGTHDAFTPAVKLYRKFGFMECGPFADYTLDPFSVFLSKRLG